MQYLHQTQYGHVGGFHTMKPVMAMDKGHIFEMKNGRPDVNPIYAVRDNRAYATSFHPGGESPHATFEIRGDKVHTTPHHPQHDPSRHVFELRPEL